MLMQENERQQKKATRVEKCGMLPSGGSVRLCNYSNRDQLYFSGANCVLLVSIIPLMLELPPHWIFTPPVLINSGAIARVIK